MEGGTRASVTVYRELEQDSRVTQRRRTSMVHSVVDLFALARCGGFIGTPNSTFTAVVNIMRAINHA